MRSEEPRRRRGLVWRATVALVAAAILPVLAFGTLTQTTQRATLTANATENLDVLADAQLARLELITQSTLSNLNLIASRTQMRADLVAVLEGETDRLKNLNEIIADAADATVEILSVSLTDTDGASVTTTDDGTTSHEFAVAKQLDMHDADSFASEVRTDDGWPRWFVASPLHLDGEPVGAVIIEVDLEVVPPLLDTPADVTHRTQTCVFATDVAGSVTPLADPAHAATTTCTRLQDASILSLAVAQHDNADANEDAASATTIADYVLAGHPSGIVEAHNNGGDVFVAAVRTAPRVDWGLVVATERDVLLQPVTDTGRLAITVMLVVGLLAAAVAAVAALLAAADVAVAVDLLRYETVLGEVVVQHGVVGF